MRFGKERFMTTAKQALFACILGRPIPNCAKEDPTPPPPANEIVGFVSTGQSLSIGAWGVPGLPQNATSRYANLRMGFDYSDVNNWFFTTFIAGGEPNRNLSAHPYPYNIAGDSFYLPMQDQMTFFHQARGSDIVSSVTTVGKDGWNYSRIEKNGVVRPPTPGDPSGDGYSYQAAIDEVTHAKAEALLLGKSYVVKAVFQTHGENDYSVYAAYRTFLQQQQNNFETDIKAITGQLGTIPLIITQASGGFPQGAENTPVTSSLAMLDESIANPLVVMAGPKYQYGYNPADNIHLLAPGYQAMGIKYAQVYERIATGGTWTPLRPLSAVYVPASTLVTVTFNVPVPPLQWNDVLVQGIHTLFHTEWALGKGFEVWDDTGDAEITAVNIVGNTVQISLLNPLGTNPHVGYARLNDGNDLRRGGLMDSDPLVGIDRETISISATNGSTTITAMTSPNHGKYDIVESVDLPGGEAFIVSDFTGGASMVLSAPWTGTTGVHVVHMRSDQRNYCVSFDLTL